MTNQTIVVNFDGYYFSYTDLNGNLVKIPAISGDVDYQNPAYQNIVDKGMLPEGTYHVKQDRYQQIDIIEGYVGIVGLGTWPGSIRSWGSERVWLEPDQNTNTYGRTGFTIHGGWEAESAGCIDLVGNADTFFAYFASLGQDVTLVVDYSKYDTSVKNPLLDAIEGNDNPTISDIYQSQGLNLSDLDIFKAQVKQTLESQLNMTLTDEAFEEIFNKSLPSRDSIYTFKSYDDLSKVILGTDSTDGIVTDVDSTVFAYSGDDVINASIGNNVIDGGEGSDTISYSTSTKGVDVDLGAGNTYYVDEFSGSPKDTFGNVENVVGSSFSDDILGNGENNILDGGKGDDDLEGGAGNDTYLFSGEYDEDTITDSDNQGTIKINNKSITGTAYLINDGNNNLYQLTIGTEIYLLTKVANGSSGYDLVIVNRGDSYNQGGSVVNQVTVKDFSSGDLDVNKVSFFTNINF